VAFLSEGVARAEEMYRALPAAANCEH